MGIIPALKLPFLSPDTEINLVLKCKAHILFNGLCQDEDQQKKQIPEVSLLSQASSSGAPKMFSIHFFFATEAWDSHSFLYISFVSIINVPEFPRTRMFPGNSLVTHKNDAISNGPCKPKHWWFHDSLALFFPAMRVLEFYSGDRMAIAHNLIMKL